MYIKSRYESDMPEKYFPSVKIDALSAYCQVVCKPKFKAESGKYLFSKRIIGTQCDTDVKQVAGKNPPRAVFRICFLITFANLSAVTEWIVQTTHVGTMCT